MQLLRTRWSRTTAAWLIVVAGLACAARGADPAATEPPAQPGLTASEQRIERLIGQLGDPDYFVRQWAQDELSRLRLEAFDALSRAENNDDIEIAERARYLVRLLRVEPVLDSDSPEVKKILEEYETTDDGGRITMARQLAELSDGRGLPALCRMLRFDRSPIVSKQAVLRLMAQQPVPAERWPQFKTTILEGLGRSPRPAADWLRKWIETYGNAVAAATFWAAAAEAETRTLRQQPLQTRAEIVIGLLKEEVLALVRMNRTDEAERAMRAMLELAPEDSQVISDMLSWLVEQKAWPIVNEAAEKFADRFEQEPLLLYTLAQACLAQGNEKLADETAARALAFHEENQAQHYVIALQLHRRSLIKWAAGEFRRAIAIGPPGETVTLMAQTLLGEMLHDHGQELEAAKVLEDRVTALTERVNVGRPIEEVQPTLAETRGQMHLFFACDAALRHDTAKQREHLLKGLEQDPLNADILIGLYRLPDADAALKQTTAKKVREAAEEFRNAILQAPDKPIAYNQLAWLLANTGGDPQEAIRCSHRSLELSPNQGEYLDTLGRCYFAAGDVENAVKYQTQAVVHNPYSGLIRKQLEIFRQAAAESKKTE